MSISRMGKRQRAAALQNAKRGFMSLGVRSGFGSIDEMPEPVSSAAREFDRYAKNYDEALAQGISVSGEDKDFFARGRVEWVSRCLNKLNVFPTSVLDFGCGTGSAVPHFLEVLKPAKVVGVDVSEGSVALARERFGTSKSQIANSRLEIENRRSKIENTVSRRSVTFEILKDFRPNGCFDLAFCNGVFHHIPLDERAGAVKCVFDCLKTGGIFAFWENNPWNPGTRYVMSRIPFDRDAIMVSALEAKRLLRAGGFEVLRADFLFIFPKALSWLRGIEPVVSKLPVGAQYQVLARKIKN